MRVKCFRIKYERTNMTEETKAADDAAHEADKKSAQAHTEAADAHAEQAKEVEDAS